MPLLSFSSFSRIHIIFLFVLLCIPSFLLMYHGAVFPGHDSWVHIRWHTAFSDQFWSGDLYPRWLEAVRLDSGSPVMFFYPPLSYYATSFIYFLFPGDSLFYLRINIANILILVLSFFTMTLFLCQLIGADKTRIAILGSLLYISHPYFYLVDIYIRGAFAESWVFVVVPFLFWGIQVLSNNKIHGIIIVSLGTMMLVTTHIVSAVFWMPIVVSYLIYSYFNDKKSLSLGLISVFLGIGMSSGYLFTALGYQEHANLSSMYSPERVISSLVFTQQKLLNILNLDLSFSKVILTISLLTTIGIVLFGVIGKKYPLVTTFWLTLGAMIFLLLSSLSAELWRVLPVLYKVQFSWRMIAVLAFVMVILYTKALLSTKNKSLAKALSLLPIVTSLIMSMTVIHLIMGHINNENIITKYENIERERLAKFHLGKAYFTPKEYEIVPTETLVKYGENGAISFNKPDNHKEPMINIIKKTPREFIVSVYSDSPTEALLKRQYFYGTEISVNNINLTNYTKPSIRIPLEKGENKIKLTLRRMPTELAGYSASAVFVLLLMYFVFYARKYNKI